MRPHLRLSAQGAAAAEVVWERYASLDLWPTWSPQIRRVDAAATRLAAGLEGRVHGPAGVAVEFVVTAVDESARTWTWRIIAVGRPPLRMPMPLQLAHAVAGSASGTTTTLTLSGPVRAAPVIAAYAPVARLALGRLVRP
ncbi:MAG: SRPBCC family protein [Nocardioidaceae bacterium]